MRSCFLGFFILIAWASNSLGQNNPIWGFDHFEEHLYAANPVNIKERLFRITSSQHQVLGYFKARQLLLGQVYLENNGKEYSIKDVYCLKDFTNRDFGRNGGIGPNKIPDNNILNTEHTWPQSRFTRLFPNETQKSDLHHLYPSDTAMNNSRGNNKFAEIDEGSSMPIKCDTSKLAQTSEGIRFEPPVGHRGNVARSLFYFSIRYKIPIDDDEEYFLRKWHNEDPVDQIERSHHEMIFETQGNRNPFIDQPELASQISNF